ncbi:MAG: DUF4349 domain-containing protein [Oscillibacter sp.]|nr:DUF4349 domain-containing protein [Oscillibacter sp.]
MKKKLFALCMMCVLLLSLAGCGGSAGGNKTASSADMVSTDSASYGDFNSGAEVGWDMPMEAPEPVEAEGGYGGIDNGSNIPADAKMIYTADLELETKEFDDAAQAIADIVKEMGGYFESRSVNQGGYYRSLDCTIRVPAANFSALLERAGEAAHVTNRHEYSDNVSEAYYDQEARLTTQRTKLERLQELLSKAENMEDIITLESAISETELQIEYLTGSLRKYDSLIDYSTINLYLREVYRLSTDEEAPVTFGQRFTSAFSLGFQRGVDGVEDFIISMARNWMTLLIWVVIIVVIVLLLRRRRRKKRAASSLPKAVRAEAEKPEDKKED